MLSSFFYLCDLCITTLAGEHRVPSGMRTGATWIGSLVNPDVSQSHSGFAGIGERRCPIQMGNCWGSPADKPSTSTTTTDHLSPATPGTSRTTSNTITSSGSSSSFTNSQFSVSSGGESEPNGQILPTPNLRIFTFAELKTATKNFRADTVLGEGGFGKVFKGWLEEKATPKNGSGTVIAVKKLNSESLQGFEEWQSEVNFLGRLSHPNLVKLLGYCWEETELLLVYEFMQRGSLENHLFGRGSAVQPLPWDIRLKIAIGAARGLAFLHTSEKVIYRDFKASNILLDGSYTAKISDFGLAKLAPSASQSHVTTRVMGTYGYAAPEYVATGHLYVKSDVYGFGVVLVEMLTALRALDPNRPSGQHNLVDWVKPYLQDRRKLKSIMDSRLEGKYPSKAAFRIAQLALKCIASEPKQRPSMKEVLEILERIQAANEKPVEPRFSSTRTVAPHNPHQPLRHRSH
ncbi:putative serine/threonine-protein kinase PIX13 [Senna tora]|uniref:non-specific serine/threonine protein kinase n=1 Tax=Senna tora TaxID=362788 RepID=A0A834XAV4_9FABA|nr:putative serine/threonine-protein kinase PIX13 [Senna tora]